jgi:predicted O-methyltransferase YrrM
MNPRDYVANMMRAQRAAAAPSTDTRPGVLPPSPETFYSNYQFSFTNNWFSYVRKGVSDAIAPYVVPGDPIRILEIGTYEGSSAMWFLTNLCGNPGSSITTIDRLSNPLFNENLAKLSTEDRAKINVINGFSSDALLALKQTYDLVYIDGSHFPDDVLEDAVISFKLLNTRGLMIFDDYNYNSMVEFAYLSPYDREKYATDFCKASINDKMGDQFISVKDAPDTIYLHQTINTFAAIYSPRLTRVPCSNVHTAVFMKVRESFGSQCFQH